MEAGKNTPVVVKPSKVKAQPTQKKKSVAHVAIREVHKDGKLTGANFVVVADSVHIVNNFHF